MRMGVKSISSAWRPRLSSTGRAAGQDVVQGPSLYLGTMGLVNGHLVLKNPRISDLSGVEVDVFVDTGAVHPCIPEHVRIQLKLEAIEEKEARWPMAQSDSFLMSARSRSSSRTGRDSQVRWCWVIGYCSAPYRWRTWI